jgi:hypothetical protein
VRGDELRRGPASDPQRRRSAFRERIRTRAPVSRPPARNAPLQIAPKEQASPSCSGYVFSTGRRALRAPRVFATTSDSNFPPPSRARGPSAVRVPREFPAGARPSQLRETDYPRCTSRPSPARARRRARGNYRRRVLKQRVLQVRRSDHMRMTMPHAHRHDPSERIHLAASLFIEKILPLPLHDRSRSLVVSEYLQAQEFLPKCQHLLGARSGVRLRLVGEGRELWRVH